MFELTLLCIGGQLDGQQRPPGRFMRVPKRRPMPMTPWLEVEEIEYETYRIESLSTPEIRFHVWVLESLTAEDMLWMLIENYKDPQS